MRLVMGLSFALGMIVATYAWADDVVCKAELSKSDAAKPVFADLKITHSDDSYDYFGAQIEGVQYEVRSMKTIFFFKPYIRTSDGQEVTASGYFTQDDTILLDWTLPAHQGVKTVANLRCCRDCTFSDWPK